LYGFHGSECCRGRGGVVYSVSGFRRYWISVSSPARAAPPRSGPRACSVGYWLDDPRKDVDLLARRSLPPFGSTRQFLALVFRKSCLALMPYRENENHVLRR
jgi:hypothetical protein